MEVFIIRELGGAENKLWAAQVEGQIENYVSIFDERVMVADITCEYSVIHEIYQFLF